jgi:hypothetical protein
MTSFCHRAWRDARGHSRVFSAIGPIAPNAAGPGPGPARPVGRLTRPPAGPRRAPPSGPLDVSGRAGARPPGEDVGDGDPAERLPVDDDGDRLAGEVVPSRGSTPPTRAARSAATPRPPRPRRRDRAARRMSEIARGRPSVGGRGRPECPSSGSGRSSVTPGESRTIGDDTPGRDRPGALGRPVSSHGYRWRIAIVGRRAGRAARDRCGRHRDDTLLRSRRDRGR